MGFLDRLKNSYQSFSNTRVDLDLTNRRLLGALAITIVFAVVVVGSVMPQRIHLRVGDVAPYDIRAPKTVVNRVATETLKAERVAMVPMVYDLDVAMIDESQADIEAVFSRIRILKEDGSLTVEQRVNLLTESLDFDVEAATLTSVMRASNANIDFMETGAKEAIRLAMQGGVKEEQLNDVRIQMAGRINNLSLDREYRNFMNAITRWVLLPNMLFNETETNRRIQLEKDAVDRDPIIILKDQIIVRLGDVVTAEHIAILEDIGLQRPSVDLGRVAGLILLVILLLSLVGIYMFQNLPQMFYNEKDIILLGVIGILTLLTSKILGSMSPYLVPVAGGALLVAILLNSRLAMIFTVVMSLLAGVVLSSDIRFVIIAMVGGFVAVFSIPKLLQRSDMTRAGLNVCVANVVSILAASAIPGISIMDIMAESYWGFMGILSGLVSAVLAIGAMPFLENTFSITTPMKLVEISNPNHPLLRRLLLEAPGSYHHSIIVGNLAEAAAEAVGADSLLARVGAYFHDIGKIRRPHFFIENQLPDSNPHDKVTPNLSAMIITSHIQDGVELAKEYRLPQRVTDIIEQHHGTSLVTYFYYLASEKIQAEKVTEEDFRYEGPLPQTKEAALVLLADSVEAAVRSYPKADIAKLEQIVTKIIRDRLNDGQLNDCDLTFKDLDRIGNTFTRLLVGTFHSRIEYPNLDETDVKEEDDIFEDLPEQSAEFSDLDH
jgi:hypothetical protein